MKSVLDAFYELGKRAICLVDGWECREEMNDGGMIMISTREQGVDMENDDCLLGLIPPFLWVAEGFDVGYLFRSSLATQLSSPFLLLPLFFA